MLKSSAAVTALCVALACAGPILLGGCGNSQEAADRAAQKQIQADDEARAKANDLKALDAVQAKYDALANASTRNKDLSPQMQIIIRSRQAQLRFERIMLMLADLRNQELAITGTIDGIEQLALRLAGAQSSIDALKAYDPAAQITKAKAQQTAIRGDGDHLTWTTDSGSADSAPVTMPTLFKVNADIDALGAGIAKANSEVAAQEKLRAAKIDEAEKYSRKAEGESGDAQVADVTAASEDRRDAAMADSTISGLKSSLAHLQGNLEKAQDQKTALEASLAAAETQITSLQDAWATIQKQMDAQKERGQELIAASGEERGSTTISQRAVELAGELQNVAALRVNVEGELNAVINQFGSAAAQAAELRKSLTADVRDHGTDPDVIIWKQTEETLHPSYYSLQKAAAMEALASVRAAETSIDYLIARMFDGYEVSASGGAGESGGESPAVKVPGLSAVLDPAQTGVEMPKALGDFQKRDSDELQKAQEEVNKLFTNALDAYKEKFGATDLGSATGRERSKIALSGRAATDRCWAEFASAVGDAADAQNHLSDANDLEKQIDAASQSSSAEPGVSRSRTLTP